MINCLQLLFCQQKQTQITNQQLTKVRDLCRRKLNGFYFSRENRSTKNCPISVLHDIFYRTIKVGDKIARCYVSEQIPVSQNIFSAWYG